MSFKSNDIQVHTYTYDLIDSKMYVMLEEHSALVIDPCISDKAIEFLASKRIDNILILLTHEHYDHMSGIGVFRNAFENCTVMCSEMCNKYMQSPTRNGSQFFKALFIDQDPKKMAEADKVTPVTYEGDKLFSGETTIEWQGHEICLRETPGHSPGSICIIMDNEIVFTGDSLLKDTPVVTKLPGGNKKIYNENTFPFLKSLPDGIIVYPGHGEAGEIDDFDIVLC